jgi:leader peptidase (prepilin peptidase)/N-methyltransferase
MIIATLIVLGLCFGSFINALVWRLHEQSLPAKKRKASLKDLSVMQGRSMCPHCQHTLGFWDLLPLVSWLALRGRCRYCQKSISWQYPVVEAALAGLFVGSYVFWPLPFGGEGTFLFVVWLIALIGLLALVIYDIRWMLLPNKIVFPLIALGAVQTIVVFTTFHGGISSLLAAVGAVGIAGGIYYVLFQASKGQWIGGGDVKLGYALGFLVQTPLKAFLVLFAASIIGLLLALPGMINKKLTMTSKIPFGPSLIAATILIVLFGQRLIDWYFNTLGL